MFVTTKQSFLKKISTEYVLSYTAQKIIESYLNLDEKQWTVVDDFLKLAAEFIVEAPRNLGVIEKALDKTMVIYRAANSKGYTEHEIIKDGMIRLTNWAVSLQ